MKRYLFIVVPVVALFFVAVADTFVLSDNSNKALTTSGIILTGGVSGSIAFPVTFVVYEDFNNVESGKTNLVIGALNGGMIDYIGVDGIIHAGFAGSGAGVTSINVTNVSVGGATTNFSMAGITLYFTNGILRRTSIP